MIKRLKQIAANATYSILEKFLEKEHIVLFAGSGKEDLFENITSLKSYLDSEGTSYILCHKPAGLIEYIRLAKNLCKAKVVVIDSQSPAAYINISNSTKVVNVWHASGAYKTLGFDAIRSNQNYEIESKRVERIFKKTDYFICSSQEQANIYSKALKQDEKKFLPLGVPRTDIYIRKAAQSRDENSVFDKEGINILYAPTFRGRELRKNIHFLEECIDALNKEEDINLFYKGHPTTPANNVTRIIDVSKYKVSQLLNNCDVLITDYSSILFDFLLVNKPIILFAPDLNEYKKSNFSLYFDPEYIAPGMTARTSNELINLIRQISKSRNYSINEQLKQKMLSSCDGKSTQRVCNFITNLLES